MEKAKHQNRSCDSCVELGLGTPNSLFISPSGNNQAFNIQGLDCVEEVSVLKREIGPLVGGEAYLSFDVLNGRMTVLPGGKSVSPETIQGKVASTGMQATPFQTGSSSSSANRSQKIQTVYTILSGVSILAGIILHIGFAGGFFNFGLYNIESY